MVVPEKILMKKIKRREKVKKLLAANKQAEKRTDEETSNDHSQGMCITHFMHFHPLHFCSISITFKHGFVIFIALLVINFSGSVPGQFVRLHKNNDESKKRKAEIDAASNSNDKPKKRKSM